MTPSPALFDTHAHLISDDWERYPPRALRADLSTPRRTDYTVTADALVGMMDAQGVTAACVVQRGHLYGYDNSYIIDSARRHPGRLLPVVILDTQDAATPELLTDMVRNQGVRGLRMANTRPAHLDTAWMSSPSAMRVWSTCAALRTPVALIFFHNQLAWTLPLLHAIARMYPQLPILVDHLGTLHGTTLVEQAWAREAGLGDVLLPTPPDYGIEQTIGRFADTPNVFFKLTEVNMENLHAQGIPAAPLVRRLADRFGADRLVWGSDVGQSLRWSFVEKARMARDAASLLDARERAAFLHDNAARLYATSSRPDSGS
jgi:predicted TIM-barrel fold metal-dependent hydrolase